MMREKLVQVLQRGKESATHIRRLIDHHDSGFLKVLEGQQLDAHSLDVLNSFATALSMIHCYFPSFNDHHDHDHDHQSPIKRPNPILKSQVSEEWEAPNAPKDARGNYYRCTHKAEQGCQATKQVQQISDNPAKYKIIYYGHHTCKNPLKNPPRYLDLIDDQHNNSSILLSFEAPNNPKHGLKPFMLSSSSLSSSSSTTTSAAPMSSVDLIDEPEYTPIKDNIPLEPLDQHHEAHIQCPSSSDFLCTTSDLTSTSFVSDDVISLAEIYSSAVSPYGVGEDCSYMIYESFDFSQVFQDSYLLRA
ncbi:hypothetical protein Cgig2_010461 [Carnegiea gigantea]|uniref:WRKY domain-containing protein n=1 Tax=Carnegiea gigantea TaxID=171969 RepID=A0A9Q1QAG1_9CARY|nr:hypothetical protein Cgig2_010461 [Carnegiea gigantea]